MASDGDFPIQRIYVATSWRNERQPQVVKALESLGYEVYDFRNPSNGKNGFAWSQVCNNFNIAGKDMMVAADYLDIIEHPRAIEGFESDFDAMQAADIFVLVLPCERDAHLELGWAAGAGKQTHILLDDPCKASLMYRMVDYMHATLDDLLVTLGEPD